MWNATNKKQFRQALQDCYPNYRLLEMFVMDELDENLSIITGEKQLQIATFDLINWALSQGCIDLLFAAFCRENPHHAAVEELQVSLNSANRFSRSTTPELRSICGINYQTLRDLLIADRWKEADEETAWLMLKATGRQGEGWLDREQIEAFPCEDLRTIDQLWMYYSDRQFGLSVQNKIYQAINRTQALREQTWETFGDRVGWRVGQRWLGDRELAFNRTAPVGNLPWGLPLGRGIEVGLRFVYLFTRVEICQI